MSNPYGTVTAEGIRPSRAGYRIQSHRQHGCVEVASFFTKGEEVAYQGSILRSRIHVCVSHERTSSV